MVGALAFAFRIMILESLILF